MALPLFFFAAAVKVTIVLTVKYNKNKHGAAVFLRKVVRIVFIR